MRPVLSIAIPVYNFAEFLPETLQSLASQDGIEQVEVVIFDGGSEDQTATVVEQHRSELPQLKYLRQAVRGGIDRDMAAAVEASSGQFVWLFSGDDIMCHEAVRWALDQVSSTLDVLLCRHFEWSTDYDRWYDYPVLDLNQDRVFDLGDASHRAEYASLAVTTEAYFSFIGGLIIKRDAWDRVDFPRAFDGTCWAHAARLSLLMTQGITLKYTVSPKLYRRPDNDSFLSRGLVERFRIGIEGYIRIADEIFGHTSSEARAIRKILRNEFGVWHLLTGKFVAHLAPEREDNALNAKLFKMLYAKWDAKDLRSRWKYWRTSPEEFARWNPERTKQLEAVYDRTFIPRRSLKTRIGSALGIPARHRHASREEFKRLDNLGARAMAAIPAIDRS